MRLPIGCDNFVELIQDRLDFVDKSLFIQDILEGDKVTLITRPRRFGKTLNMSMLHCFFAKEVNGFTTQGLFDSLKIAQAGVACMHHQGKYPVIFLSLKDVKETTFDNAYAGLCDVLSKLYTEHEFLLDSPKVYNHEKEIYLSILQQRATLINVKTALQNLTLYLHRHYGIAPVVLIDEYDTPIQSGYLHGYYEKIVEIFRYFLGAALKGNPHFFKAVLTGILRVSKENLFSGLNNLKVYSVLDAKYSDYFGFTESEVASLLDQAGLQNTSVEIKNWYNGYQIGDTTLYNPWSIVNCIQDRGKTKLYWVNTSDNSLIKEWLLNSELAFKERFSDLMAGKTIECLINEHFVFPDLKKRSNEAAIWSLLLMAGYLKVVAHRDTERGAVCQLAIPNLEVRSVYLSTIEEWLANGDGIQWYLDFIQKLLNGDIAAFEQGLEHILMTITSAHDMALAPEAFYHGLMIGLTASLYTHPNYETQSNREAGYGRYDFMIFSRDPEKLTLLFEFKKVDVPKTKRDVIGLLKKAAAEALLQIEQQAYFSEAKKRGAKRLLKIGIAFSGKRFGMVYDFYE